ncbi:hypothetical protein BHM03_00008718 [Ensete ventricosum]|nr:hypothetical protein BHM03_00008718 [Ensete ventricosum]
MVNQLEGAVFAWRQRITEETTKKSAIRYPWPFVKENGSEAEKRVVNLERAEALVHLLRIRFPNLPQSFIDVTKVQHNKDVGHAITEAYSRVLGGLAFRILSRIGDIFQEDDLKNPTTPIANLKFDFSSNVYLAGIAETPPGHIKRSLIDQMNTVDGRFSSFYNGKASDEEHFLDGKARRTTVVPTNPLLRSRAWC